jgi:hypothetical protein
MHNTAAKEGQSKLFKSRIQNQEEEKHLRASEVRVWFERCGQLNSFLLLLPTCSCLRANVAAEAETAGKAKCSLSEQLAVRFNQKVPRTG